MRRLYSEGHLWVDISQEGNEILAKVGFTEYFLRIYGDIEEIELPEIGDTFEKGEPMGEATTEKRGSVDIIAPLSGEIVDVNSDASDSPEMVVAEPEDEDSWILEVRVTEPYEVEELMEEDDYENYAGDVLEEEEYEEEEFEEEEFEEEEEFLEEEIEETEEE